MTEKMNEPTMEKLIKDVLEAKGEAALEDLQSFEQAAQQLGYSPEDIAQALDAMPLDDDALDEITGGGSQQIPARRKNYNWSGNDPTLEISY